MIEVDGRWRKKLEKKILLFRYIILMGYWVCCKMVWYN